MAFKQVFCALREVFPQVDLRILKAVASQYSSDVDAAVGFVFSDVLPAVSELTETHYTLQHIDHAEHDLTDSKKPNLHSGRISSVDLGAKEDASVLFGTSAENSIAVGECNPFSEYDGPFCSNNKIEKCSQIEDKVVINEIKIPTTAMNSLLQEHCTQVGSSSTSQMAPHMIEYEHSDSGGCNDCAAEKDKVTPETENIGTPMHYNDNCDLSDLFASSGSMLPLFMESSSDCAVKHEGKMPLELSDAISKHDIANLEDNCCLETLFGNFHSTEERHTSKNLLDAPTVLSKPKDNYDLQVLFENIDNTGKDLGVLHTAETPLELNKLANDGSFHSLFGELCTVDKTTQVPSIFPVKGGSNTVHKEELTLIHSNNCGTLIHCNFNDDKHFVWPIVELDAFRPNEEWKMPVAHKSEGILDISTHSYHITDLNKNFSDTTKSKELLTSLYESTIMKMKEVELQEENSRLAKQNAYTAHQNFLAMVEHFDHLIENSKESNDKQAQVVCEEKCLLVALTQDLQSQLTKLSAQRDEALTAVQEIKCELDARLATSMEEEATAMDHIIQKEKLALLVRKEKEATMGSIMEESRKLQQEAEENTLLRRLLLDQGRLIDIMQGEMSSIHANFVAMKERTRGSKLKSTLVMTSCSANSYHKDDCKSALADTDRPMGNGENRNDVPHEETTRSLAKDHTSCPDEDDEWEVLETNYA